MHRYVLPLGPLFLLFTLIVPPVGGLSSDAWHVAGLGAWMALWWLTAVIPLEATALLPIVILPIVTGQSATQATAPYANPIIFLFLGGFFLAATLERWELHRRFAITTVQIAGTKATTVVLAFMTASAFLSMWISNTATAVMMLPIAKAVVDGAAEGTDGKEARGFAVALLLGMAYACSIGGVTTLIGTPPNAILAGSVQDLLGRELGFGSWMLKGASVSIPMLFLCWFLLIRVFRVSGDLPALKQVVDREVAKHAPLSRSEKYIIGVFALTATAWIMRAPKNIGSLHIPGLTDWLPGITDTGIAIGAAILLFAIPLPGARFKVALNWESARKVPWGILLLFGGGLSLAAAFAESGLSTAIGGLLQGLKGVPAPVVYAATATLFVFLTELTSNAATTALGMPLMAGVGQGLGMDPLPLMVAAALASSMAFMLPVATPPNAIVFSADVIKIPDMAKAGFRLNILAIIIVTLVVSLWM